MPVSIQTILGTDAISSSRITINNNYTAITNFLAQLEANLNPVSSTLNVNTATVGQGGLTINPSTGNTGITINATQPSSFVVDAVGNMETKQFVKSLGKWSNNTPQSYNQTVGVWRLGDATDPFISTDSAGFLAEALFPSANNSLQTVMSQINPGLDLFKDPANGGTLSQVLRLNNTQITRRLLLSNNGGQTGGSVFNVFEANVPASSVNTSTDPSILEPNQYGYMCQVRVVNGGDSFWIDTSSLENGETFWVCGAPDSETGTLFVEKPQNPSQSFASNEFNDSVTFPTSGADAVLSGTIGSGNVQLQFGATTRLLLMNVKDGTTADRLQILSYKR